MPKRQLTVEEQLRASEERYQAFIRNSSEGIWRFELEKPIPTKLKPKEQIKLMYEYAYLAEANDAMAKMYGLDSVDEIVGARLGDFLIEGDRENIEYLTAFVESGYHLTSVESHEKDSQGNEKYFSNSLVGFIEKGNLIRAWGTQKDVTEKRKAEIALQISVKNFHILADKAPVFIWLSDTKNLGTYFNKPWLDFTGRTIEQELGTGWVESVHPDDVAKAATYCQKCFDERKEFQMEFRLRRHDGTYRWVLDHGIPRFDSDGNFVGYIGSCLDIEDFKRSLTRQERLEATNTSLKKQRKQLIALNDAKDEFISIASHQLRTPTTTVKQYLGMLLEGYAGNMSDEQLSMIMTAYDNNERQLKIITDLLRVAHVDAGKVRLNKAETDLAKLIASVITDMHATFDERKQQVVYNPPKRPMTAQIDARLLRMVLENMIENASKYSPAGSKITIGLDTDKVCNILQISDNGVGIDKKDQAKLFHKFTRIDNPLSASVGGTGLGLYWVKKIIDLHGGKIDTTSEIGKGTSFTISLPK